MKLFTFRIIAMIYAMITWCIGDGSKADLIAKGQALVPASAYPPVINWFPSLKNFLWEKAVDVATAAAKKLECFLPAAFLRQLELILAAVDHGISMAFSATTPEARASLAMTEAKALLGEIKEPWVENALTETIVADLIDIGLTWCDSQSWFAMVEEVITVGSPPLSPAAAAVLPDPVPGTSVQTEASPPGEGVPAAGDSDFPAAGADVQTVTIQ